MNPLPCPFCQSSNVEFSDGSDCIICNDCNAFGPTSQSPERAVILWNRCPRRPEPAVPDEPVKSEAFMCGYERAQGRWEATHEELYEHNCWLRNPFEVGTDEQKGFSQAVYDLTK